MDARQLARTRHFQLREVNGLLVICMVLCLWSVSTNSWRIPALLLFVIKKEIDVGSEFAPYCFKNTILNCAAVAWCRVEQKIDCRHKTEMQQLVTSSASCSGHHAPLRHCDYYNVKLQPTDPSKEGDIHIASI